MARRFETSFIAVLVFCRWLMAPIYVGLLGVLLIVAAEFFRELAHAIMSFADADASSIILVALKLIDLVLVGHLTFIMIFAGLEMLRSVSITVDRENLPHWTGSLDFSSVKLKIIGSIVAIAGVDLLEIFFDTQAVDKLDVLWKIVILLTLVTSGFLLVVMDRVEAGRHANPT
jgi:uncharacterized protein (TIGR00645 family)